MMDTDFVDRFPDGITRTQICAGDGVGHKDTCQVTDFNFWYLIWYPRYQIGNFL